MQGVYLDNDLNKHYSHALKGQEITDQNGVITAVASAGAIGGGHTIIFTERLNGGMPENQKIELRVDGKSGGASGQTDHSSTGTASSSSGIGYKEIAITNQTASDTSLSRLQSGDGALKRSWVVKPSDIEAAQKKADEVSSNKGKYSYTLLGVSLFRRNAINCARFGEQVLKAAGISSASAGSVIKKPSTLASGANVGYMEDPAYVQNEQRKAEEKKKKDREKALKQQKYAALPQFSKMPPGKQFKVDETIMGSSTLDGTLELYTFRVPPNGEVMRLLDTDIEVIPWRFIVDAGSGKATIERKEGRSPVYVEIEDLFDLATAQIKRELLEDVPQP